MSTCLHSHRIGMRCMRGVPDGWWREPTHSFPLRGVTIDSCWLLQASPGCYWLLLYVMSSSLRWGTLCALCISWRSRRASAGSASAVARSWSCRTCASVSIAATSVCPAVGCEAPVWQSFGQARAVAMRKTWRFCICANKVSHRNQCLGLLGDARSDFVLL